MLARTHVEFPADDLARATAFSRAVFGSPIEPAPGSHRCARVTIGEQGHGAPTRRPSVAGTPPMSARPLRTGTDDLDAALASITANGGTVAVPAAHLPLVVWHARLRDPAGHVAVSPRAS